MHMWHAGRALEKMVLCEPPPDAGLAGPRECVRYLQAKLDEKPDLDSTRLCDVLRGSIKCRDFNVLVFALDILENLDIGDGEHETAGDRGSGHAAADSHDAGGGDAGAAAAADDDAPRDEEMRKERQRALPGVDLKYFGIKLLRIKCRFTEPTPGGWADLLVNFYFVDDPFKHVVEVQRPY